MLAEIKAGLLIFHAHLHPHGAIGYPEDDPGHDERVGDSDDSQHRLAAGGWTQLGRQTVLALVGIAYPFVMTWIVLWATDHTVGLQVSAEDEEAGLDLSEHGEPGYQPVVAAVGAASDGMMAAPDGPRATEAQ